MKSPKVKGIGEVVTEYGAKVMKVIKKGLLGRSLFDFYGDIKAQTFRTKESASVPNTPTDGAGGIIYTKSADGKLYYKSNEVAEVELSAADSTLTQEQVEDFAGALIATGGTKTGISVTYQDGTGDIDFVVDHDAATNFVANEHIDWTGASAGTIHATNYTNTTYSEATSSAEGLMSTAHHDKLDGIEAGATADQTQADINGLAITTVGTVDTGTWQGTAIASAYLDADTAHLSGTQAFTGKKTINIRAFDTTDSSTDGDAIGDIVYIGAGMLTAGKIYYLRSNEQWNETNAGASGTSTGLIGVACGTGAAGTVGVLLRGMVTLSEEIGGTEAIGSKLYLDTTAATATITAPSASGDIVRVIGYALSTSEQIWFNPSGSWVEIA